jgi:hypothetical protein
MSLRERTRQGLGIIEPCLPSPAKAPPSGPGWIHEIKHDGFRIMARMATIPFVRDQTFEPEQINAICRAYQGVCLALGLPDRGDPLSEIVLKHLVKLAESGIRIPTTVYIETMKEFKSKPQ